MKFQEEPIQNRPREEKAALLTRVAQQIVSEQFPAALLYTNAKKIVVTMAHDHTLGLETREMLVYIVRNLNSAAWNKKGEITPDDFLAIASNYIKLHILQEGTIREGED